jgi:hypothetical protein
MVELGCGLDIYLTAIALEYLRAMRHMPILGAVQSLMTRYFNFCFSYARLIRELVPGRKEWDGTKTDRGKL